jgi:hypothetical protein
MPTSRTPIEKQAERLDRLRDKQLHDDTPPPAADVSKPPRISRSLTIAKAGLRTGFDTINILTATITDVLEDEITTNQANVVVNAIGKVLKVVELQLKYGKPKNSDGHGGRGDLVLTQPAG